MIKLKLKETNRDSTKHITQPDERCYTVTQLDDLQSKLMLVAGQAHKGKEHIARFVEVSCFEFIQVRFNVRKLGWLERDIFFNLR